MDGGPDLDPILVVHSLWRLFADERRLFLVQSQVKVRRTSTGVVVVQFHVIAAKTPHINMRESGTDPGFPLGGGANHPAEGRQHMNSPNVPKNCGCAPSKSASSNFLGTRVFISLHILSMWETTVMHKLAGVVKILVQILSWIPPSPPPRKWNLSEMMGLWVWVCRIPLPPKMKT